MPLCRFCGKELLISKKGNEYCKGAFIGNIPHKLPTDLEPWQEKFIEELNQIE